MLSERYRYPRPAYAAKFAIIAGIVNIAMANLPFATVNQYSLLP
jgi:hypothetical protein